ncbi:hypothetical protein DYB38_005560 [Aphanomyces astaci]|uniref:FAD-binding PCMH-type domain-containing protein n=2 Tax=Aphanomyces astaci TaxID=112090 RepID=A0A397C3N8_APHAT|nr:hypothetical protein DYB38_005560 [Aphanomyces astaci]
MQQRVQLLRPFLRRTSTAAAATVPFRRLMHHAAEYSSRTLPQASLVPVLAALAAAATSVTLADGKKDDTSNDSTSAYVNWSATHDCHPVRVYEPESVAEVESIVAFHHLQKTKLRPMGSGVSPNGLGFSDESILVLSRLDNILHVDEELQQVTVEGGVIVGDLLARLRTHGLTLQNVASIREQTIAGVTQAGCHGTGASIPPMEEQIVSMDIVTPANGRLTLNDPSDPRFQLAKCGLGALGVVTQLTLQCVRRHYLVENTQVMSISQLRQVHPSLLKSNQHVRYMWLPYTSSVVVVTSNPSTSPDLPADHTEVSSDVDHRLRPLRLLYADLARTSPPSSWRFTQLRDALYALDPLNPAHIARITQVEVEYWRRSQGTRVALSDDVVGFDCGGQQLVSEVAFPMSNGSSTDLDFMEALLARIQADHVPAHTPIEQRWTARSRAALSPAHSAEDATLFSWVGIILYLQDADDTRAATQAYFAEYSKLLEDVMAPYGATEHWAKLEVQSKSKEEIEALRTRLSARFPAWKAFKTLRDEWDPNHVLSNEFVDVLVR